MKIHDFIERLQGVKPNGDGWMAQCPAHEDEYASLSISEGSDGRILLHCFAGCQTEQILNAMGLKLRDISNWGEGGCVPTSGPHLHTCIHNRQHIENMSKRSVQVKNGDLHTCTLVAYAKAKGFPTKFLVGLGLSDVRLGTGEAVRIPYFDKDGNEAATRYRIGLNGGDKFRWKKGSKPFLYGLWRLDKGQDYVILCEGESDCHSLWFHGFNALGLPGASNWKEERDAGYIEGFEKVYIIREPDQGGEAVLKWLSKSKIRSRAYIVRFEGYKDPSALHIKDPENFKYALKQTLESAVPFTQIESQVKNEQAREAWEKCKTLARKPNILEEFGELLPLCGLTGEERNAKIIFLAFVSRLLDRPVSVVVGGPSAAGKSFLVETVLNFFPTESYHDLTAMSDRNLAYTEEPLSHRFLILYEAAGLNGDFATYLIRSLLSEGRIKYEFVEKTKEGLRSRLVQKDGPTGLIMTTTAVWLHPENETRLLALTAKDDKEQTSNVLLALAQEQEPPDYEEWKALQIWLECQEGEVVIPYSVELAKLTKPVAVRLRRDFSAFLSLIKAHALLHMATRERDEKGRIIATLDDYEAVLNLVGDIIAESAEASVPSSVRQTVATVRELVENCNDDPPYTTVAEVKEKLNLDRSAALRRLKTAIRRGFVKELENKGKEKKYNIGEPLPTETGGIFPTREELDGVLCMCAKQEKPPAHIKIQQCQQDSPELCMCADGVGEVKNSPSASIPRFKEEHMEVF